jgi:thermostable 8-oxoguanine DNA glycosylase
VSKFQALKRKGTKSARLAELRKVLHKAGVRWPEKKSTWLAENFDLVAKLGGPRRAKALLLGCRGREAMIEFWRQFKGMRRGEKYPRNIMMDCFHPDFRNCIAVDARIKGISRALGLSFQTYEEEETFYLDVAKKARLEGWALDRMMYGFRDCIVDAIDDAEDLAAIRSRQSDKTIPWEEVKRKLRL